MNQSQCEHAEQESVVKSILSILDFSESADQVFRVDRSSSQLPLLTFLSRNSTLRIAHFMQLDA